MTNSLISGLSYTCMIVQHPFMRGSEPIPQLINQRHRIVNYQSLVVFFIIFRPILQ